MDLSKPFRFFDGNVIVFGVVDLSITQFEPHIISNLNDTDKLYQISS